MKGGGIGLFWIAAAALAPVPALGVTGDYCKKGIKPQSSGTCGTLNKNQSLCYQAYGCRWSGGKCVPCLKAGSGGSGTPSGGGSSGQLACSQVDTWVAVITKNPGKYVSCAGLMGLNQNKYHGKNLIDLESFVRPSDSSLASLSLPSQEQYWGIVDNCVFRTCQQNLSQQDAYKFFGPGGACRRICK